MRRCTGKTVPALLLIWQIKAQVEDVRRAKVSVITHGPKHVVIVDSLILILLIETSIRWNAEAPLALCKRRM